MKIIKKLGMEKEFNNWVKDIRSKPRMQVGSRVRIKENVKRYNLTTPFSEGVIVEYEPVTSSMWIKFDKLTCPRERLSETSRRKFQIEKRYVELI